jgi:hypothetical protein
MSLSLDFRGLKRGAPLFEHRAKRHLVESASYSGQTGGSLLAQQPPGNGFKAMTTPLFIILRTRFTKRYPS